MAASIEGKYNYVIVDGNLESDPLQKIEKYLSSGNYNVFASSVMPGPQLKQAIPFSKLIREKYADTIIIWGGYFASNQAGVVMNSGFVDHIIYGPGDHAFPKLLDAIQNDLPLELIPNLIHKYADGKIIKNHKDELYEQDALAALPYEKLNSFYPIKRYLGKTCLGTKTIAYHSSIGCPFSCAFCGIVPIFNARWKGKSAQLIYNDIKYLKDNFGGNAIEFHDNNFLFLKKDS